MGSIRNHRKKPKTSSTRLNLENPSSSKISASILFRYPDSTPRLRRIVHAPCRVLQFQLFARMSHKSKWGLKSSSQYVGNNLHKNYQSAKNQALSSLIFFKEYDVNEVEGGHGRNADSEVSTLEEIGVEEYQREVGKLAVSNAHRYRENDGVPKKIDECQFGSCSSPFSDATYFGNPKVEDTEKMLDMLSLSGDDYSEHVSENLWKFAQKKIPKLPDLGVQIESRIGDPPFMYVVQSIKKSLKEDKLLDAFVPLTREEADEVSRAFSARRKAVLATHEKSNIIITGEEFQCLRPDTWLNDEVINLYLELLKERESREPAKFLKCHFFNTFFYKRLISGKNGYDYKSVRRWTTQRRLGYTLIECDKIFVPIHKEIHWCLVVIDKKDKKFQYLDSLGGVDPLVLKVLARYIVDEVKDKCRKDIDVSIWEQEQVEKLPEQKNGSDCGMFMIKYADFYSRGLGLCFKQENMSYFRKRTAKEILRLRAD